MALALGVGRGTRVLLVALLGAAAYVLLVERADWGAGLGMSPAERSGWALVAAVALLAVLHVRKRLSRIPLLPVSAWVTAHIGLGLLSGALLVVHVGARLPTAPVNWLVLALFLAVFASGLVGWWLSRAVPARLRERGEDEIYERIPARRAALRRAVLELVDAELAAETPPVLADVIVRRVLPFFDAPRHRLAHLARSQAHLRRLLDELSQAARPLGAHGEHVQQRLEALVRRKDALDYAEAHQAVLKHWLFVHIPLTWALLLLLPAHVAWALIFAA